MTLRLLAGMATVSSSVRPWRFARSDTSVRSRAGFARAIGCEILIARRGVTAIDLVGTIEIDETAGRERSFGTGHQAFGRRPRRYVDHQCRSKLQSYSITSSARSWIAVDSSTPIALAVFRLMTNSNFVACSSGRSAGFVPLSILAT